MSTQFPLKSALFAAFLVFFSFPLFAQYTLNGVCSNFTIKGTLVSGDSIQQGRTSRDGLVSICGNGPKACVFFSTTGSRYYDTHTVTNPTESSICVNVRLSAACTDNPVYLAIYSGRFNPADLCQNYLSNSSDSHENGPVTFSFNIPARQTAVLVPHMVDEVAWCQEGYTIEVWTDVISVPAITVIENSGTPNDGIICRGNTAILTANGSQPYRWSTGATTASITVNTGGTYSVTVSNGTRCASISTRTVGFIGESTPATITIIENSRIPNDGFICGGDTAMLTASGGQSYRWNTGATAQRITVNTAGTYTVTVNDGSSCERTATQTVVVQGSSSLVTLSWSNNDILCKDTATTLTASGSPPYLWSTGATTASITVNTGGTYMVTVGDGTLCVSMAAVTITQVDKNSPNLNCHNGLTMAIAKNTCTNPLLSPINLVDISRCNPENYIAERNINGNWVLARLNSTDINQTVVVRVRHIPSGNNCLANVRVIPAITRCEDLTVSCALEDYRPDYLSSTLCLADAIPIVTDNCPGVTRRWADIRTDYSCTENSQFVGIIARIWEFIDASGDRSSCKQNIYLKRTTFEDVVWPEDITVSCQASNPKTWPVPRLEIGRCSSRFKLPLFDLSSTRPTANNRSFDVSKSKEHLIYDCDGSYKQLRTWRVINWCLPLGPTNIPVPPKYRSKLGEFYNNPLEYTQEITVTDTEGPTFPQLSDLTVSTDKDTCCATVDMPDVVLADSCSRIASARMMIEVGRDTFIFSGVLSTFPGNNLQNPDTLVRFDNTTCLPVGNHRVTYTAADDCGNQSSATFMLRIQKGNCPEPPGGPQPLVSGNVPLRFDGKTGFELYQNAPNPWDDKTVIGFQLPETSPATLTVYDQTGRILFRQKGDFGKGYNAITIDRNQLNYNGLMFYKLDTEQHTATRKFLMVNGSGR